MQLSKHLTGFTSNEIHQQLKYIFNLWLEDFGQGNKEEQQIIETLTDFLSYNRSQFATAIQAKMNNYPSQCVGFVTENNDFYLDQTAFKKIFPDFNKKLVLAVLETRGILQISEKDKKVSRTPSDIDKARIRRYHLRMPKETD